MRCGLAWLFVAISRADVTANGRLRPRTTKGAVRPAPRRRPRLRPRATLKQVAVVHPLDTMEFVHLLPTTSTFLAIGMLWRRSIKRSVTPAFAAGYASNLRTTKALVAARFLSLRSAAVI